MMLTIKDYLIIGIAIIGVAFGVFITIQRYQIKALKATVQAYEERDDKWSREMEAMIEELNECLTRNEECAESIRRASLLGAAAQAAQKKADEYAERLLHNEQRLTDLERENDRFTRLATTLTVCETYEFALRSIAGEAVP